MFFFCIPVITCKLVFNFSAFTYRPAFLLVLKCVIISKRKLRAAGAELNSLATSLYRCQFRKRNKTYLEEASRTCYELVRRLV